MRPVLSITFPKGFRVSKNIGHLTSGTGGKKTVKRYLKSEQTDRQTHKQTYGHFDQRADALKRGHPTSLLLRTIKYFKDKGLELKKIIACNYAVI